MGGKGFKLIDTPGLEGSAAENLNLLKDIARSLTELGTPTSPVKVSWALFFHRITDGRFSGTARSHLDIFKQICGKDFTPQAAFVTTMWNRAGRNGRERYEQLSDEIEERYFRLCSNTIFFRFQNDESSAREVLDRLGRRAANAQLLFADEMRKSGPSLSGMRKTSAGKAVLKGQKSGGSCVIL